MAVRLQSASRAIHVSPESRDTRSAVLAAEDVSRGSQACSPTQDDAWQRAEPIIKRPRTGGDVSFRQLMPAGLGRDAHIHEHKRNAF